MNASSAFVGADQYYVICLLKQRVRIYTVDGVGLFSLENDGYYVDKDRSITRFRGILGYLH